MELELIVGLDLCLWTQFLIIASKHIFVETFTNLFKVLLQFYVLLNVQVCIHLYNVHSY